MNLCLRKKCIRLLLTGTTSLFTLSGFSIKNFEPQVIKAQTSENLETDTNSTEPINIMILISNDLDYCSAYRTVDSIKRFISQNNVKNIFINIDVDTYQIVHDTEKYISHITYIAQKLDANKIPFTLMGYEWQLGLFEYDDVMEICDTPERVNEVLKKYGKAYYNDQTIYKEGVETSYNYSVDDFVSDEIYIVKKGDNIKSIAKKYDIEDYEGLAKYNRIKLSSELEIGTSIIIPSKYGTKELEIPSDVRKEATTIPVEPQNKGESPYLKVDEDLYYKGIDVSEYQGLIDWDIAEKNVDYVIIRMADACRKDSDGNIILDYFYRKNMSACQERGIPMGVYIFTRAHNEEEMRKEIDFVLSNLKDEEGNCYNITLPVYIDVEESCSEALFQGEETRKNEIKLIKMFCEEIKEAGFVPGIYINSTALPKIKELINEYSIWTAGGALAGHLYNQSQTLQDMYYGYHNECEYYTTSLGINMVQTTSHGSGKEVGAESQYVDLNYADKYYIDYLHEMFCTNNSAKFF